MTADIEAAREAGRRWAQEHPLSDQQKQRIWAVIDHQAVAS